ncbi:MAG: hypothetical protein WAO55_12150 [Candidatus Manganitrophaceae bacterium]
MPNRTDADLLPLPLWLRRLDLVRKEYRALPPLSASERSRQIFELMTLGITMASAQRRATGEDLSTWMRRQDRLDQMWKTAWKKWREAKKRRPS